MSAERFPIDIVREDYIKAVNKRLDVYKLENPDYPQIESYMALCERIIKLKEDYQLLTENRRDIDLSLDMLEKKAKNKVLDLTDRKRLNNIKDQIPGLEENLKGIERKLGEYEEEIKIYTEDEFFNAILSRYLDDLEQIKKNLIKSFFPEKSNGNN